jgi:glycosyltransferase involved in cell wall biosynthesis
MRIAYLCDVDADNVDLMSGYPHAFLRQFERLGHEVIRAFPLSRQFAHAYLPYRLAYKAVGRTYRPDREIGYLRSLARQAEARLRGVDFDIAFAPGSHLVAEVNLSKPIVFCADASFASVVDRYWDFSNCSARFLRLGHRQDQRAHDRCAAAIYPSEAFAGEAAQAYRVDPGKLHVVPWGSSLRVPEARVRAAITDRTGTPLRILFVGKDWRRKGGDIVLETCRKLEESGLKVQLDLVGIEKAPVALPPFATLHGLLNQRVDAEREALERLFLAADIFFVPSRAENFGLVFCEALAFGVPVVSTAVGGIPTIVRHGRNGFLLPAQAGAADYASLILDELSLSDARKSLSVDAFEDYRARLTWDAFGDACQDILTRSCERGSGSNRRA